MNPTQLPTDGTLPLLVLQIIAVSGEFPAAFSGRFPGGCSYIERTQADRKCQTPAASKISS